MKKYMIALVMLLVASAHATQCPEVSIDDQCAKAEYIVVGRLKVYSPPFELEDNGMARNRVWAGYVLAVEYALKGTAAERLVVDWLACSHEEEGAIEMDSYFRGSLSGVWFVLQARKGDIPIAFWRPRGDLLAVVATLKRAKRQ